MARINFIKIQRIKNVANGEISFNNKDEVLNTVGIYGANGTGKSALVEAFSFIQHTMLGKKVATNYLENMVEIIPDSLVEPASILVEIKGDTHLYRYEVFIERNEKQLKIVKEHLLSKELKKRARWKNLIAYVARNVEDGFPLEGLRKSEEQLLKKEQVKLDVLVKAALVGQTGRSLIFSQELTNLQAEYGIFRAELPTVIEQFTDWSENMLVFSSKISGSIYANLRLPLGFSLQEARGFISFSLDRSNQIRERELQVINHIFRQINQVLPKIIPDLKVTTSEVADHLDKNGVQVYKVDFMATRLGDVYPLRVESDGIKKIISILSALINAYNNEDALLVIDELDAGIYEFLLGEIVKAFANGGKGLLIFTSHNLRPLEVLSYKNIIFTTLNEKRRYIVPKSIKETNNLRDVYIRKMQLGGESEALFEPMTSGEIRRAFRRANRQGW